MSSEAPLADLELLSPESDGGGGVSTSVSAKPASKLSEAVESHLAQLTKTPWDPMSCPEWDASQPLSQSLQRIRRDLMILYNDPPHGIFVVPDENNLSIIHALIVGPYDTPYEGGFFYFLLRCPPDYPIRAPKVRLMTTGNDTVRFNPNLYRNGKVCLSILGTWSGPAWSPAQSLCSVLVSIQSLLNEQPYHNEPGFEKEHASGDSARYNQIIQHETVRVAVCEMLESATSTTSADKCPASLKEVMRSSFSQYYEHYVGVCERLAPMQGIKMVDPFGEKRGKYDPQMLMARLKLLKEQLKEQEQPEEEDTRKMESDMDDESTDNSPHREGSSTAV